MTTSEDAKKRQNLARLRVAVRVACSVVETLDPEREEATPDFLGILGWMQAWPYLRTEIQPLSTKLGFPPLTLPILLTGQTSEVPVEGPIASEGESEAEAESQNPP